MTGLKILGMALLAVLAIGVTAASADELTSEASPVVLTGKTDPETVDQVLMTWGVITCPDPTYTATTFTPTTAVTVTPSYAGQPCSSGGLGATVHMNGCTYLFHVPGGTSTTGDVDLICPAGQEVTITITAGSTTKCSIHFKPQTDIGGTVTYSNIGAGTTREITVDSQLTGIDYAHTAGTGIGACTTGSSTSGTVHARAVVTGESHGGAHRGVFMS